MKITEFLTEAPNKTAVVTWGRMNPPTVGHQKVVDTVKQYAQKFLGDPILFLSKSQKPKTDPLSFAEKVHFAEQMFSIKVDRNTSVKTIIQMFQHLQGQGYNNVILVAGSDRVQQYQDLMDKYNGKPDQKGEVPFKFANMKVVSSGERDPDAEGVAGMSASKLRSFAVDGDFGSFKSGVPGNDTLAKQMYNRVRAGMGLEVSEMFGFATKRPKSYTVKKRPPEKDEKNLNQRVQDRLQQIRKDQGTVKKEDTVNELDLFAPETVYVRMADKSYYKVDFRRHQFKPGLADGGAFFKAEPLDPQVAKKLGLDGYLDDRYQGRKSDCPIGDKSRRFHPAAVNSPKTIAPGQSIQQGTPWGDRRVTVVDFTNPETMKDLPNDVKSKLTKAVQQAEKNPQTDDAAGVGIVTKQNATKDVPVGGEYMNVKKLKLGKGKPKKYR